MRFRQKLVATSLVSLLVLSGGVPSALAAPDAQAVADAYGDLTVFILNVAAGNDGQPQKPQAEQSYKATFAELFANAYADLTPDQQESLTVLPVLDAQLHDAWPNVPLEQRNA